MPAYRRSMRTLCLVVACMVMASTALAQTFRIGDTTYTDSKISGTVVSSGPGWVTIQTTLAQMQIIVSDQKLAELKQPVRQPTDPPEKALVVVSGTAHPSYLVKDQFVNFTAELKNGKSVEEVKELTLFTPNETQQLGIFSTTGPTDGDAANSAAATPNGTCLIAGQIAVFGKGQLMVTVPTDKGRKTKVTVKLSDSVKVSVRAADLTMAQPGDMVSAQGYIATRAGQPPQNQMLASLVEVRLVKPLMSKAKRRELAAAEGPGKKPSLRNARPEPPKKDPTLPMADDDPPAGLKDPSMPEKPERKAKPESKDSSIVASADDPSPEALIVADTFVVDETSAFDDDDSSDNPADSADDQ